MASKTFMKEVHALIFSKRFAWVCVAIAIGGFFFPRNGTGESICGMERIFGLPCPGCGMTRSVASLLQGHFAEALQYHPFGLPAAALLVLFGLFVFVPSAWLDRMRDFCDRHSTISFAAVMGGFILFFGFGLVRLVWAMFHPESAI